MLDFWACARFHLFFCYLLKHLPCSSLFVVIVNSFDSNNDSSDNGTNINDDYIVTMLMEMMINKNEF